MVVWPHDRAFAVSWTLRGGRGIVDRPVYHVFPSAASRFAALQGIVSNCRKARASDMIRLGSTPPGSGAVVNT